eukprot:SAG31_NODE_907_length_11081_cov_6.935731_9_plen_81_part_00
MALSRSVPGLPILDQAYISFFGGPPKKLTWEVQQAKTRTVRESSSPHLNFWQMEQLARRRHGPVRGLPLGRLDQTALAES